MLTIMLSLQSGVQEGVCVVEKAPQLWLGTAAA